MKIQALGSVTYGIPQVGGSLERRHLNTGEIDNDVPEPVARKLIESGLACIPGTIAIEMPDEAMGPLLRQAPSHVSTATRIAEADALRAEWAAALAQIDARLAQLDAEDAAAVGERQAAALDSARGVAGAQDRLIAMLDQGRERAHLRESFAAARARCVDEISAADRLIAKLQALAESENQAGDLKAIRNSAMALDRALKAAGHALAKLREQAPALCDKRALVEIISASGAREPLVACGLAIPLHDAVSEMIVTGDGMQTHASHEPRTAATLVAHRIEGPASMWLSEHQRAADELLEGVAA